MIDILRHDVEAVVRIRNVEIVKRLAPRLPYDVASRISRSKLDLVVFLLCFRPFYQFAGQVLPIPGWGTCKGVPNFNPSYAEWVGPLDDDGEHCRWAGPEGSLIFSKGKWYYATHRNVYGVLISEVQPTETEWSRWTNLVAKFMQNDFQAMLVEREYTLAEVQEYKAWLSEYIGDILFLRHHGILDAAQVREVFRECWEGTDVLSVLVKTEVLNRTEGNALSQVVAKHLAASPKVVADYKKGRKQSINALIGPILREIKADANEIRKLLIQQVEDGNA